MGDGAVVVAEERWLGAHGDVYALADDASRDRAVLTIGTPGQLSAAAMLDALPTWERLQQEIAAALSSGDDPDAALKAWERKASDDPDLVASLYKASLQADLGGQLFVRTIEVPESTPRALANDVVNDAFLRLPFAEAIQEFLARRLITPDEFRALSDAARQRSFTASGLATAELRARAYRAVLAHLREGGTLAEFVDGLRSGNRSLGVTAADSGYLENVYRTNIQAAYGAGRYRQITSPVVAAARPYVEYRTAGDSRVRAAHRELNGVVFRQDDPEWPRYAPPNGFMCRCAIVVRREEDVDTSRVRAASDLNVRPDAGFDAAPTVTLDA